MWEEYHARQISTAAVSSQRCGSVRANEVAAPGSSELERTQEEVIFLVEGFGSTQVGSDTAKWPAAALV